SSSRPYAIWPTWPEGRSAGWPARGGWAAGSSRTTPPTSGSLPAGAAGCTDRAGAARPASRSRATPPAAPRRAGRPAPSPGRARRGGAAASGQRPAVHRRPRSLTFLGHTWHVTPAVTTLDDPARIAELHEYGLLDAPADRELEAVLRAAAAVAGVPTATINLI